MAISGAKERFEIGAPLENEHIGKFSTLTP